MKIWIISPVGSDKHIKNLIDNYNRQEYSDKGLIVVENGEGLGACSKYGFKPDFIIRSNPPNQAIAKNLGVQMVRKNNGEFWTTFDDDDYYSPLYLNELATVAPKADIIGKQWNWVEFDSGLFLFRENSHNQYALDVQGPTISAWTAVTIPFRENMMISEDIQFCKDMVSAGARVYRSSIKHFCYNRKKGVHRWSIKEEDARKKFGDGKFFGKMPYHICDQENPLGGILAPTSISDSELIKNLFKEESKESVEDIKQTNIQAY